MNYLPTFLENGLIPDETEEITATVEGATVTTLYMGFFAYGDPTKAMIRRIMQTGEGSPVNSSTMYPNGSKRFDFNWAERATFDYAYRKN